MASPLHPDAEHEIVVGIDGREEAYAALDWAVAQAKLTGARVRAICAWHYVPEPTAYLTSPPVVTPAIVAHAARRVAFDAAALYDGSGVTVVAQAVQGIAWRVLVDAARDADLLVIGTRSRPLAAGALLGSVTLRCMAHSSCPVVVVPTPKRVVEEQPELPSAEREPAAYRPRAERRRSRVAT